MRGPLGPARSAGEGLLPIGEQDLREPHICRYIQFKGLPSEPQPTALGDKALPCSCQLFTLTTRRTPDPGGRIGFSSQKV